MTTPTEHWAQLSGAALVTELRGMALWSGVTPAETEHALLRAADEIERLTEETTDATDELNRLRGEGPYWVEGPLVDVDGIPAERWEYLGP